MSYESPTSSGLKVMAKVKVFSKEDQMQRSQGQKLWYLLKVLVTRNTHVQYESSTSSGLKVRGRPFDPEGGGGLANLVGTNYLFSSRTRPENSFQGKPRTEYLFSTATNF